MFGYLGAEELRSRTSDGSTGNYGQADQRQAMRWVQQNIAAFGGDKERVMIFGQSSGAGSVSTHLVAPQSFGLFSVAGMSSGAFGTWISSPMNATPPILASQGAQATFDDIAWEANCSSAHQARAVDARRRLGAAERRRGGGGEMVLRCLESLSTDQLVTLDTTRNAAFGPVVDGVELTDTPHSLLRQGKIDPQLRAVMVGSTGEDSGATLEHNASSDDFRQFMAGEYLFKDYPKINQTLDRLVALYGAHDGRPPPVFPPGFPPAGVPMPAGNFSFTRWYWAAKHALADAELFCPAQMAARQFTRRNVSAFQFQWRHTPLEVTCTAAPCNAAGAPHSSDLAFWFSIRDGQNSVRSVEELTLARRMTEYLGHIAAT